MTKHTIYLSLGTNLGDKDSNIHKAISKIQEMVGDVVRQSSLLETQPWGFQSQNMFVNAAVCVETTLSPWELLNVTQQIERDMGRTVKSPHSPSLTALPHYQDRIIDIDILLYDDVTVDEPDLKIPHPLMQQRDFVMIPLNEVKK